MSSENNGYLQRLTLSLSEDQIEHLKQFSIVIYSHKRLGEALGLMGNELNQFITLCTTPESEIYNIIKKAKLQTEAAINYELSQSAKVSSSAYKDYIKALDREKAEAIKEELFPGYAEFKKAPKSIRDSWEYRSSYYDQLEQWIMSGKSTDILPPQLKEYWQRLKIVRDISNDFQARAKGNEYIINLIRETVGCSESHAYVLLREASTFFNISEPKSVWHHRLLLDLDRVKTIAFASNKYDEVLKAIELQSKILKEIKDEKEFPAELFEGKTLITSHNPEDFGLKPIDRDALFDRIKKWKLTAEERKRIIIDAGIDDKDEDNISE